MSHEDFPLHDAASAPEAQRAFDQAQQIFGMVPNLIRKMASAPALAEAYLALNDLLQKTSLSPTEQGVLLLTVSRYHECDYCMAAHSMTGRMTGVPDDVIAALREDRPIEDPKLEALRQFTRAMIEQRGWVDEPTQQTFLNTGHTPAQMLEVILAIGLKTLSNYTNHIAGTPVDEPMAGERWTAPGP
ncbi:MULTISPECIES: carboxymuconolactone decarboxylase family protein [unclassified Thioalkalivibrio]|uniref:carboxymuconolactone decarboxylase family protein n=1 Tax=unclassified Thioalkalivibrio TaxID=2621013 RepID=UPI00036A72A4|nr:MULTISPECIES: carboxymuconolactone decarboxylase family protein [unclassified Thioalkalivibrio]